MLIALGLARLRALAGASGDGADIKRRVRRGARQTTLNLVSLANHKMPL